MLKVAFSFLGDRIAPVFDSARYILIIDFLDGRMVHRTERKLQDGFLHQKAFFLSQTGVEILVCGAISMSLHEMIKSYGITVIPFVTGNLDVVIQAWSGKKFSADAFTMPGFNRRRQRRFHETGHCFREEHTVNTKGRGGAGQGGGGCRRAGTGGGQNTSGFCVCPQCDHREPHERGTPCFEKKCPKCGAALNRG